MKRIGRGNAAKTHRVRVLRDRPALPAWIAALAITALMVCFALWQTAPDAGSQSVFAAPEATREIVLQPLEMYLLSLYRCETGAEARLLAAGCAGRGAAGYVCCLEDKWHVMGAAYTENRDAQRAAERLIRDEGLDAQVVPVEARAINLRITAPEIQIDAVGNADRILQTQAESLGETALQLERGKVNPGTACTLCAAAATQAEGCAKVIRAIPGADENALSGGLAQQLDDLGKLLNAISEARDGDRAALAGMMRCAQIDVVMGKAGLHDRLLDGR